MSENDERDNTPSTGNLIKLIVSWASGQPFNNVMLLAIFGALCWITHFAVTVAIPAHLRQIQDVYEKLEKSNMEERKDTIKVYDKWFERMEKYHDESNRRPGVTAPPDGAVTRPSLLLDMENISRDGFHARK